MSRYFFVCIYERMLCNDVKEFFISFFCIFSYLCKSNRRPRIDDLYKVKGEARLFSIKDNKISRTLLYKKNI
jgi:hypothetical protein